MADVAVNDVSLMVGTGPDTFSSTRISSVAGRVLGWNGSGVFGAQVPGAVTAMNFSVHKNGTDQTIATATTAKVTFSTAEFDAGNTPPNYVFGSQKLVAQAAGKHSICAQVTVDTESAVPTLLTLYIYKNNVAFRQAAISSFTPAANGEVTLTIHTIMDLALNDAIEIWLTNAGANTRTILGSALKTNFHVHTL